MQDQLIPKYDDNGRHIVDPNDRHGYKTNYITQIQIEGLSRVLEKTTGAAVDIGCGYGRLTCHLHKLGFDKVIGVDPSARIIDTARKLYPGIDFRVGGLPNIPLHENEVDTFFILSVLRVLKMNNILSLAENFVDHLPVDGRLIVMDNLRLGDSDYLDEATILKLFLRDNVILEKRMAIRGARWPWLVLIKYGLVPGFFYKFIIKFELMLMRVFYKPHAWQYINVVWVFRRVK